MDQDRRASSLTNRTIQDFGEQFTRFSGNEGYYGSLEFLQAMLGPLLDVGELQGKKVAEIGSGAGRIVLMLLEADVSHITALEPSMAMETLRRNVGVRPNVTFVQAPGEQLPKSGDLDYVFSIGVLQFIPDPWPVVDAAFGALRPGGAFIIRVYSREGNGAYLAMVLPLRAITTRIPNWLLTALIRVMDAPLMAYIAMCRYLPLPMHKYFTGTVSKLGGDKRRLVIFDQLNPSYAKYYRRQEVIELLGGFENAQLFHHEGSIWTAIAYKPET